MVNVPAELFKVPLLVMLPFTFKLAAGLNVLPVDTVILPKVGVFEPDRFVIPSKVIVAFVKVDAAFATKSPLNETILVPALNEPFVKVKVPFAVKSFITVRTPVPVFSMLLSAVAEVGNSAPVLIAELLS